MFAMPPQPNHRSSLPQRTVSRAAANAATFSQIEEELRDVKRVQSQGQEEDLRMALSQTIGRVEELSSLLKEAYKVQADLQTELTLAKSNLQLALANNEMLEDALKRDGPGHAKDVGWRRSSAKEQRERELAADSRRQSTDSVASFDVIAPSPVLQSPLPSAAEGRFFKFRFGNTSMAGVASPRLGNMSPNPNGSLQSSHLTSASLPSLVPARDVDKELEDLNTTLEQERKSLKAAQEAKEQLEAELESLSQALFEEANKMVAAERMKLAETEEELKEAVAEKEALRSALKLVEHQRKEAESRSASPMPGHMFHTSHSHKRSSSSAIAIKSLPSSQPSSAPSSPRSAVRVLSEPPSRAPVPPRLDLPEVGLASSEKETPLPEEDDTEATPPDQDSEVDSSSLAPPKVPSTVSSSSSSSPTPSPGHFGFASSKPVSYFDTEESPWADACSASSTPAPTTAAF
ncbi:hypothetical protein PHLGIDRAFT_34470 [Phlebiopsis gigantea 11061_1 CR5-6]|uniref:GDP/GTP exchange factor Sec2 N-terminal domain-containing protein n=1 Tax=Phlebiopsis gigantea (strain 11061_1 CR5-6) TaxID=745531 RepID=A0A0C3NVP5_PHLG1|nr:hypothetical protein PHLGIDRAFT_34470 [Phlebiopsis gigantea 11061_1 CR5-6]